MTKRSAKPRGIALEPRLAKQLTQIASGKHSLAELVRIAEVDPVDFREFMGEVGLLKDPIAHEILQESRAVVQETARKRSEAGSKRDRGLSADAIERIVEKAVSTALKRQLRRDALPVQNIALVERREHLRDVLFLGHQFEVPQAELLGAVVHNIGRGVMYFFFVSPSELELSSHRCDSLFGELERSYRTDGGKAKLYHVTSLGYEWNDYPHLFYCFESDSGSRQEWTIGFRGTQTREGIADYYREIPRRYAHTIARTVLRDPVLPKRIQKLVSETTFVSTNQLQLVKSG